MKSFAKHLNFKYEIIKYENINYENYNLNIKLYKLYKIQIDL